MTTSRAESELTQHVSKTFVLNEDELKKLNKAFGSFADEVTYEVTFGDDVQTRYAKVQDVTALENSARRPIRKIQIHSRCPDYSKHASVEFDSERNETVFISISGPEYAVVKLSEALQDRLLSMRPWYAWLSHSSVQMMVSALFIGTILFTAQDVVVPMMVKSANVPNDASQQALARVLFSALLVTLLIVPCGAFGFLVTRYTERLFPRAVFCIGQGQSRHSRMNTVRAIILTAIFLTLPLGILGSWIAGWLPSPF